MRGISMKNTLTDLNNIIFEQMEILRDADDVELESAVKKARAINNLANTAVQSFNTALNARKAQLEYSVDKDIISIGDKNV